MPALKTEGVISIVGAGNQPIPILNGEIDAVRQIINSTAAVEPWPYLRSGEKMTISDGPLCGVAKRFPVPWPPSSGPRGVFASWPDTALAPGARVFKRRNRPRLDARVQKNAAAPNRLQRFLCLENRKRR